MTGATYDVVVIGAGISGIYAARCLKEEGLKFVVLEARDRVGGRTWTLRADDSQYVDMGGAYFGHQQTEVVRLAKELGLGFYPVPDRGDSTLKLKGRVCRYSGDIPAASNIFELIDLVSVMKEFDRLSLTIPLLAPWTAPSADELDAINITDFLEKFCWTSFAKSLVGIGLSMVFALPPDRISLLYALHLIRSCGGLRALFDQKGGLQEMKVIGGSDSISQKMAKELETDIRLNSRVQAIVQRDGEVEVITENDDILRARAVIVASSPVVLQHIAWNPKLPDYLLPFLQLPKVEKFYAKTVMYYEKPFWEVKGLNGSIVSDEGIVRVAFPDTKHDGSFPSIMGFVFGNEYHSLSLEERKTGIAKHYAELFGIREMEAPCGYLEKWWTDPEELKYSGPCVYALPPKFMTRYQRLWGESFGRIYFAGSESSTVSRGYMDGAVRAGALAVKQILNDLNLKARRDYSGLLEPIPYMKFTIVESLVPRLTSLLWGLVILTAFVIVMLSSYFLR